VIRVARIDIRPLRFLFILIALAMLAVFLALPAAAALADVLPGPGTTAPQPDGPVVTGVNIWLLVLGYVSPLVAYLLNHFAPWVTVQIKGIVIGAVAAAVALVYQLVSAGNFGWNYQTLVAVVETVLASIAGHASFKASGINVAFGAGSNASGAADKVAPGLSAKQRT
jgi:hypothetical protein